jgi:sugar lactone lactonase YvrE
MRDMSLFAQEPDLVGESPFWEPRERALYWIDIGKRKIKRRRLNGPIETWPVHSDPGCIAPREGGGLVVGLRDGIYLAAAWGAPLERATSLSYDCAKARANDGKAGPDGRFWVGTMYEPRDQPAASLYSIDFRNPYNPKVQLQAGEATVGNGLAWSPDSRTVYWADTKSHTIWAWDWDSDSNTMRKRRVFHKFAPKPSNWIPGHRGYAGRPDGAAVDVAGNYWCAMFEGARLSKISPSGELLEEIRLPVLCPTMLCFGGDDLKTIFVTSARPVSSSALLEPSIAGHILSFRTTVPGRPVDRVRG